MLNEQHVEEILENYKPLVISIAKRYYLIGADMDDLIQEGMIGLYKAIKNFDETKNNNFANFAGLCITRNIQTAIKNGNRLKNNFFKDLVNEDDLFVNQLVDDKHNPEEAIISKENFKYVKEQINEKLSDLEKGILREYLNKKSYDEIALTLNISKKSVDNGLNRIRKKLSYLIK